MVINMSFFDSESTSSSITKVRPTVVRTQNVAKELIKIAKSYDTNVENLDFNLLDVQTYARMNEDKKEAEWEEIAEENLYQFDVDKELLNKNFQMKQMYEVEIFTKNKAEDPYRNFDISVGANATKCKIYLSIKEGSEIDASPRLEHDLLILINKKKIRANILINIFDEMLSGVISKMSAHIQVQEKVVYDKNETILIAQSFEPTPTKNDILIFHFDKEEDIDEKTKIDYAQRGFIKSVLEKELLIEYKKPVPGKPGRNCRGEFINPKEPEVGNAPEFKINGTIKKVETENGIEYYAEQKGYISFENETYGIKTDVEVGQINFKTTGSISSGIDSDVSINVKETDSVSDAIGSGMTVEVSEIDIEGNVGSNAIVHALKATIHGQTHKTSEVRADVLRINTHKGKAYGKNIKITRLEHGTIDGDIVEVTQASGGDIRAKEITIELCGSYVKATASRFIEIKKLQGSENVFTIDPILKKDAQQGLGNNQENIQELEDNIKHIEKEVKKYTTLIKDNLSTFQSVKKRLIHYKKNGVKMPSSFVKQYNQHLKAEKHLKAIKEEYSVKTDQHALLTTRTASFQDNIFDARIINRGEWVGYNELRFKLVDPPVDVSFTPKEGSIEKVFALVELEDGEYQIQAVKE